MTTINKLLLGALAIQSALAVATHWPDPGPAEPIDLVGINTSDLKIIRITGRKAVDETPEATLELLRGDTGWLLHNMNDYPIPDAQIAPLLETIGKFKGTVPIATQASSYASLEVDDNAFTRKLELEAKDGTKRVLFIGAGEAKSAPVRVLGEDEVWSIRGVTPWNIADTTNRYFEREILKVDAETVDEAVITRPGGVPPIAFRRGEGRLWTIDDPSTPSEGMPVDQNKVTTFVNALLTLRIADPVSDKPTPEMGLDGPDITMVTWTTTAEGQSTSGSYRIGGLVPSKANRHYARVDGQSWVFEVMDNNIEQAIKKNTKALYEGAASAPGGPPGHGGGPPGAPPGHGGAPPGHGGR